MADHEAQPNTTPSPDKQIFTFKCFAVCNDCGQNFTLSIHDENPEQAIANFLTVLTIQHGFYDGPNIAKCLNGGGQTIDSYNQVSAIKI